MIQFRNCTSLRIHYSRCGKWPANKRLEKKNLPVFTFVNAYFSTHMEPRAKSNDFQSYPGRDTAAGG